MASFMGLGGRACMVWLVILMATEVSGQANFDVGKYEQTTIFNVTEYGAVADGTTDNSNAFLDAWKATCAHEGNATFLVPRSNGSYLLGPVTFSGPCYNNTATNVIIKGTLKALPDLKDFPKIGWVEFNELHEISINGGGTLDGQGSAAWELTTCPRQKKCKNLPTSLRFNEVNNMTVANLNLVNSKGFHMNFHKCFNVEARRMNITAPRDSPNTDGIHISGTANINITHMTIGTGDDCVSIGPGSTNVRISNITCGPGHGISVGSLGKYSNEKDVAGLKVRNCTLTGTTNGVRIKTWPGAPASRALNLTFEDILMHNVSNPIIIDQEYCPSHNCNEEPSLVKLAGIRFRRIRGTSHTEEAVHMVCSEKAPCENVELEDIDLTYDGDEPETTCEHVKAIFLGAQKPSPCQLF